jgi:hypothetical protein
MVDINYEKMWQELIDSAKKQVVIIPDGAKTKSMFKDETGLGDYQAETFLKHAVAHGKLRMIRYKNCYYYFPA